MNRTAAQRLPPVAAGVVAGVALVATTHLLRFEDKRIAKQPLSRWLNDLDDPVPQIRQEARAIIERFGEEFAEEITRRIQRRETIDGRIHHRLPLLLRFHCERYLGQPKDLRPERLAAIRAVRWLPVGAAVRVVPPLRRALEDALPEIRTEAARSLGVLGPRAALERIDPESARHIIKR